TCWTDHTVVVVERGARFQTEIWDQISGDTAEGEGRARLCSRRAVASSSAEGYGTGIRTTNAGTQGATDSPCQAYLRPEAGKAPGSPSDRQDRLKIPLPSWDPEQRKSLAGMAATPCTPCGPDPESVWERDKATH